MDGKNHKEGKKRRPLSGHSDAETEEELYAFFQDLCTVTELRAMEQRFEVAMLLKQGMIYNDILERTGASSATISRVNRSLAFGHGGYQTFFDRQAGEKEEKEAKV